MERTVTCPKCGKSMRVNIWSETLAQVLKCTDCGHIFTYDPARDRVEEAGTESTRESKNLSVSEFIGKGIRKGRSMAVSPVSRAKKELIEMIGPRAQDIGAGSKTEETPSREVRCPYCGRVFRAALPNNNKPVLTTKCPECGKVFTFLRERSHEERKPEEKGKTAVTDSLNRSAGKEKESTGAAGDEKGAEREGEWDSIIVLKEDEEKEKKEESSAKKMIEVVCPECGESFETVPPEKRGKVSCPICEHEFEINNRGEYIAKKAEMSPVVGMALSIKRRVENEIRAGIKEAKQGLNILKNPHDLRKRMRAYSGIAGLLLLLVSILGFAYSGALALSIPGLSDKSASGTASVSGEVLCGNDSIEGAEVNLTDVGLHTTTNGEGSFRFEDVPAGDHTIKVSAPGKGVLTVRFNIGESAVKRKNLDLVLELPENGTVTRDLRSQTRDNAGLVNGLLVGFVVLVSLLTLYAALLSLIAERFWRTLFLSGVGALTFGFLIGSALAIAAMVLIILGKKEFAPGHSD